VESISLVTVFLFLFLCLYFLAIDLAVLTVISSSQDVRRCKLRKTMRNLLAVPK
jgi:hypothetical protein